MPTEAERIVGKVWYSVPLLGFIAIAFTGGFGSVPIIILTLVAVTLVAVNTIITKKKTQRKRGDNEE